MSEQIIQQLQDMGFTAYESKAYVTLLRHNPATGYEVSAKSEVPRSAIYDVLKRLEGVGLVNAVHAKPRRYIPLPPENLLKMLEEKFQKSLHSLRKSLDDYETETEYSDLWHIQGYDNMLAKCRELIRSTDREIYASIWTSEMTELEQDFRDAQDRGINIVTFSFTQLPIDIGTVYSYAVDEEKLEEIWSRKIVLIVDKEEVLMGEADRSQQRSVVWTRNPAIVSIATNHIVLDITLFGQRYNVHIEETVNRMMNGGGKELEKLLNEADSTRQHPVFIEN